MSLWKLFQSSTPSAGRRQYNLITSSISQDPVRKTQSRLKQINCERTRVYIISAHRHITEVVLSQSPGVCSACKLWCSPKKKKATVRWLFYWSASCFRFLFLFCFFIPTAAWLSVGSKVGGSDIYSWLWPVCFLSMISNRVTFDPWGLTIHRAATYWILALYFGTIDCEPWLWCLN